MPLTLVTIPCLSDNYAYLLHNDATGETALIDAPESGPITTELSRRGWTLTDIVLTHHHWDHVDGVEGLRNDTTRVTGAAADAHRLPPLTHQVQDGDTITLCGARADILDVSGHTVGHIAIHLPDEHLLFTADSLMAMGCGRLFEGTPDMMWASLQKLRSLPDDTTVCSGHEYTATNIDFALSIDPNNPALIARADAVRSARTQGQPTVPSRLSDEKQTNPFLRADDPALQSALGMTGADNVAVFTEIRSRRNNW